MSDAYLSSGETFTRYIGNPLKQLNLGYTLTSFFYLAAVFIGALLIFILSFILLFNEGYNNNSVSKRSIVILGWVGFSLVIVGIWLTISNFYTVTNKINKIVRQKRNCALFLPESAESAIKILVSEAISDQKIEEILQIRKDQAVVPLGKSGEVLAGDPYLVSDASGSVIAPEVNPELYGLALPAKTTLDEATLRALREGRYSPQQKAGAQQFIKGIAGIGDIGQPDGGAQQVLQLQQQLASRNVAGLVKANEAERRTRTLGAIGSAAMQGRQQPFNVVQPPGFPGLQNAKKNTPGLPNKTGV
jgi:hypothetical protein